MRTVLFFTLVSVIIVLRFDWNGWQPKRNNYAVESEEPIGTCGNYYDSPIKQPLVFKEKCATCHALERDGTGPALVDVIYRIPGGIKYLELFLRNEDSLIKAKDRYAIDISESRAIDWHHNYKEIPPEDWEELVKYFR